MTQSITVGRTVHYILSERDAHEINRRRTTPSAIRANIADGDWPLGAQAHIGEPVKGGEHCAAVVVSVKEDACNLKVLLDGTDTLWVVSPREGTEPGEWHWPERD